MQYRYSGRLSVEENINEEIEKVLYEVLGLPSPDNNSIVLGVVFNVENGKDEKSICINCTCEELGIIKSKVDVLLKKTGLKFEEIFSKEVRHVHLHYLENGEDHEGIAYEMNENEWHLYYAEGPLLNLNHIMEWLTDDELREVYHFICIIAEKDMPKDKKAVEYFNEILKDWVKSKSM